LNLEIHLLAEDDFETADTIFHTAFGHARSRVSEMPFLQALQPDGRFIAREDGKPVGLVGMIDYGRMAYIGALAVLPEYQSRGIGRALMEHVIAYVHSRGPRVMLLEATPAGARLYPKLGFVTDGTTRVYRLQGEDPTESWPDGVCPMRRADLPEIAAFDAPIFGDDRTRVIEAYLRVLPQRAFVVRDEGRISGYLFAQARRLGPWAARGAADAEVLLQAAMTLSFEQPPAVVIPERNKSGTQLLEAFGFTLERSTLHMRLGGDAPIGQRSLLYALATSGIG
jgi:GNAT superfamily N-acetyltransferase